MAVNCSKYIHDLVTVAIFTDYLLSAYTIVLLPDVVFVLLEYFI